MASGIRTWLKEQVRGWLALTKTMPPVAVTLFTVSVVAMNLLANKELFTLKYLALDCGYAISWFAFLCMDVICIRFGAKAALKVSIFALVVNLLVCGAFKLVSLTPGMWGEYYSLQGTDPQAALAVNDALNATIGGSWYVVLGSALAMLTSSAVNAGINHLVGLWSRSKGFRKFALRSFISSGIAQFVDNMVFTTVVSHVFFGWTWTQVVLCSLTGAAFELLCEAVFSPLGYKLCLAWEKSGIGNEWGEKM